MQQIDFTRLTKSTNVRVMILRRFARSVAWASPRLAAWALDWAFLRARRHATPPRERVWLQGARRATLESGRHRLAAWSIGRGPTVLLVHGWEGRGSQMGAFIEPLVAAGFRVVTFDAPGHGRSTGQRSSLVEMADAVSDIGRAAGPLYGIVAHSAGAAVTTMALADGLRAEQVVFLAPPADPGRFLYALADWLGLPEDIPRRTQERIERRFDVRWKDLETTALAPRMKVPLLILQDRDDRQVRLGEAEKIRQSWPQARLLTTTGLGHVRPLREPGVVTTVTQHLKQGRLLTSLPGTRTA